MISSQMLVKFVVVFQILASLTYTNARDCESKAGNSSEKLKCRLFSNYNSSIAPNTTASHNYPQKLDLRIFHADIDVSGILQLIGDAQAIWQDNQMTWEPSEYNDTYHLDISNDFNKIWRPDFILINNVFHKNKCLLGSVEHITRVTHNGTVTFRTPYISIQARCQITIKSRPWFNHACPLQLKTNSPNFIITIHHENVSSSSKTFNDSTDVKNPDFDIKSPWIVNETQNVQMKNGSSNDSTGYPTSINVTLHRNIELYKSTQCISYPSSYEAELNCYLVSNFDLLKPAPVPKFSYLNYPYAEMIVSYMDFNIEDGTLLLIGKLYLKWNNLEIKWNYLNFGRYFSAFVEPDSIWKPGLTLDNNLFQEDYLNNKSFNDHHGVYVTSYGDISWTTSMNIYTKCDTHSSKWPWDPRTCSLNFTTDTSTLRSYFSQLPEQDFPGVISLWEITDAKTKSNFPKINVEVTFKMKNHPSKVVLCWTFVAMSSVTLVSFLIPPTSRIKLASKISSLLLLLTFLVILMYSIPYLTTIAHNFVIGCIVLLSVIGLSSCITTYMVWFARKSGSFHPSLIMEVLRDRRKSNCGNDASTHDSDITEDSSLKRTRNERLKTAAMIEYFSLVICLIIVTCLSLSLMT